MRTTAHRISWLVPLLILASAASCKAGRDYYPAPDVIDIVSPSADCLRVEEPPELDGVASEPAWLQTPLQCAWVDPKNSHNRISALPLEARFLYDDSNIYVFFEAGPAPQDLQLPAQSGWRMHLIIDPRPDHINVPWVQLIADGTGKLDLTTYKIRIRDDDYKALAQPQGKTVVDNGRLHGEFAIPIAGLMADPPAVGDVWDLEFALRTTASRIATAWYTYSIRGRLRFVSDPSPAPAYRLTKPQLPITPHHGSFPVRVTVQKQGDGLPPSEIVARGLTGQSAGEVVSFDFSPAQVGKPITFVVEMPEPGWGAVRFELRRGAEVTDVLMLPVQIEPQLPRFADTVKGSFECHVDTFTPAVGRPVTGQLDFAPFEADETARVAVGLEALDTIGDDVPEMPTDATLFGRQRPLTATFSLDTADLPCGLYRVAGTFEVGGGAYRFESQPIRIASTLVTDYETIMADFERRFAALGGRQLSYPFQRDCAELLLYMLRRHAPKDGKIERRATEWAVQLDGMLPALQQDRDYFAGRSGPFLCAYRSRVDGSLQPYEVNLPEGFDSSKKWPVIFGYHGTYTHYYSGVVGLQSRGYQPLPKWPVVAIGLEGRHPVQQLKCMADVDFTEVYEQVKEHFGMDPDRLSITGFSRGAWTSCYFAMQLPHLFASSAPCAHFAHNFIGYAPNMRHVHFCPYHSVHDERCEIGIEHVLVGVLTSLGGHISYQQYRTGPHTTGTQYRDRRHVEKMLDSRRVHHPSDIQFVCSRPRYNRAYWVSIERLIEYGKLAKFSVRVTGPSSIEIETNNVGALSLDLTGDQVHKDKPVAIVLNGKSRTLPYAPNLRVEMQPAAADILKTPDVAGPLADWMFGKSLIVYGTEAGTETAAACKALAEQVSKGKSISPKRAMNFVRDAECEFPIKADTDVVTEDVADCNLVLIGGPGANLITSRIADRLPVRFDPDGLDLGDLRFSGRDASVAFIYPNPENPRRYVVVVGAADSAQPPAVKAYMLRELRADLVVVGGESAVRQPRKLHFDAQWRLQRQPALCQVPAGIETDWDKIALNAVHQYSGADVTFHWAWRKLPKIVEGPLYYCNVIEAVGDQHSLVAFTMTGAQLTEHLRSWIMLYGKPPLLRGMKLAWHIDPVNKMVRIDECDLRPEQEYVIVAAEETLMRPCWDAGEHVQYRLLDLNLVQAVAQYLQDGNLGRAE